MKRYPSYKDSGVEWIGKIPDGWDNPKLKYHIEYSFAGEVIDRSFWGDGEETLYTTSKKIHRSTYRGFDDSRRTTIEDLLLSRNGDGIVHVPDGGAIYTNVVQLIRIKNGIDRRFLWYSLTHQIKPLNQFSDGDFIVSLNKEQWFNLRTPIPRLSDQQQITAYLDNKTQQIDTLIEKTEQKIALLKEKRTALISQVVTKGLDPDVEMKDSGIEWIGEIPKAWELVRVGYVSELITGFPFESSRFDFEEGVKILRGENVSEGFLRWGNRTRLWKHPDFDTRYELKENDIIIGMDGSKVGKNYIKITNSDLPLLLHQRMCRLRLRANINPNYILYHIGSNMFRYYINTSKTDPMIPHITQKNVYDFKLPLPDIKEQQQIANHLDEETSRIDSLVEKEELRIDLLKNYRQSLISEVVTGKIDVREEVLA
jgi:type I restriction enzyme, S subunit